MTEKKPLTITIATVVYNGAHIITNSIESVISQTYPHIEYVIVDGASTDNTVSLVKGYQKEHPVIKLTSEPDKGIYDAMNKALKLATGDFILFLGSDDQLYKRDVLKTFAGLVSDMNSVYYGDVFGSETKEIRYGSFTTEKLVMQNISHQAIFYPKRIYKNFTYNTSYKLFSDWDYNLKLWSQDAPFTRIDLIVTLFAETGLSIGQDASFLADRKELVKKYFGTKYLWLLKMQKTKKKLLGNTDLRKVKGYFFHKLK